MSMNGRRGVVSMGLVAGLVCGVHGWAAAQEPRVPQRPAAVIIKRAEPAVGGDAAAAAELPAEWLGLALEPLSDVLAAQMGLEKGMVVDFVAADGPARKAGLQKHDILLEANGTPIKTWSDLLRAVAAAGRKPVVLAVLRAGKPLEITVAPEPRPAERPVVIAGPDGLAAGVPPAGAGERTFRVNPGVTVNRFAFGPEGAIKTLGTFSLPGGYEGEIANAAGRPGEIVVRKKQEGREEQVWKTTPDKLDVLPEEVRPVLATVLAQIAARPPRIVAVPRAPQSLVPTDDARAGARGTTEPETAVAIAELKKAIDELRAEIARLAVRGAGKD
jgi:membrane-associated protease RseP (regulator of RpoE activity)